MLPPESGQPGFHTSLGCLDEGIIGPEQGGAGGWAVWGLYFACCRWSERSGSWPCVGGLLFNQDCFCRTMYSPLLLLPVCFENIGGGRPAS